MAVKTDPDWSLMQSFLAVAEGGSLSAATPYRYPGWERDPKVRMWVELLQVRSKP